MPTNSRIKYDFTGNDATPYRLMFIIGDVNDIADPAVTPIDFPDNFLLSKDIKTDWGFSDKYPIGMFNVGIMNLNIDLSTLTGAYGADADFWDVVRQAIIDGESATDHATIYRKIPNRWTLYSGATYTNVEFDGFQIYNPDGKFTIKNKSVEYEITINDALSSILKNINPYLSATSGLDETLLTYQTADATAGRHIYDLIYTYNSKYIVEKKVNPSDTVPYFATHGNFWTWLRSEIQRYLRAFYRVSTLTFNTNITKPRTLNNSNELSHMAFYQQDPTLTTGESGSVLTNANLMVYVKRYNTSKSRNDYGLLYSRNKQGWAEYDSLLDVFQYLTEGLFCKAITDFNPATGTLSLGFHKMFERTLGTTQKVIENTGYDDGDTCTVTTEDSIELSNASWIVACTSNYADTINDGVNSITESVAKTYSEDSLELQVLWQNNYSAIDGENVKAHYNNVNKMLIENYTSPPTRNLYYKQSGGVYDGEYLKVHETCTLDTGDGVIPSSPTSTTLLPRSATANWDVERETWTQWNNAQSTTIGSTGLLYTTAQTGISVMGRRQLIMTCTVNKATADNSMLGDIYQIDLDSFVPNGAYLSSKYYDMAILVNVSVDYISGKTEATFWIPGRSV